MLPSHIRLPLVTLALLLGGLASTLAGCASTRLVDRWTAPGLTPADLRFQHVVAIAVLEDPTSQRVAEDALAQASKHTRITPAYAILSPGERADPERLRVTLTRAGVDGVLTVRLVDVQEKQSWVPGSRYVAGGGYWGYYGHVLYEPGHYRTDTLVRIETTLHDAASGTLLWSGISETMNPPSVRQTIAEVAKAVRADLAEQGLLP